MSSPTPSSKAPNALRSAIRKGIVWSKTHIPAGLRTIVGLLLIVGGIFGFLPILGFWMAPLGIAIIALDVVPLWKLIRGRLGSLINKTSSDEQIK